MGCKAFDIPDAAANNRTCKLYSNCGGHQDKPGAVIYVKIGARVEQPSRIAHVTQPCSNCEHLHLCCSADSSAAGGVAHKSVAAAICRNFMCVAHIQCVSYDCEV